LKNTALPLSLSSFCLKWLLSPLSVLFLSIGTLPQQIWALPQTTTNLAVNSAGVSVTTVSSGSVVVLRATVTAGGVPVTTGQVKFCDASAAYCSDIHVMGTAQLTSAGTATFRFVPGIGNHSYKALFLGRFGGSSRIAGSASNASPLMVMGTFPTTTSIASSGNIGNYSLAATVTGIVNSSTVTALNGLVSFLDTTNNNYPLSTSPLGAAMIGLNFVNSSNPATVPEPNVVAAADFNGDGIPDLAVSNSNSGGVLLSILLGKGDGTFSATATSPTVGLYPDSIVVADFNADGVPDLALTSVDQNIVTVLLGNGDGTFKSAPNLGTGSTPQSVATGDFNGDGIADLAVVNGNSVLIFLGNGDGTFTSSPTNSPTGMSPITAAVGDYNGDGIPDLAVVNSCGPSYPCNNAQGTVTILLGKGDGTFTASPTSPVAGPSPGGLVVADFNGDGIPDLAVSNYGNYLDDAITIFLGNGDGTFNAGVNLTQGSEPNQMAAGDFNGDGIPDLAISFHWNGNVTILPGKGDGTFGIPLIADSYANLSSGYLAAADFNGDGVLDLAIPDQDVSGTVAVLLTQLTQTVTASSSAISPIGEGSRLVDAAFAGNANYSASTSDTTSLTAQPLATTLNLNANPTSSSYGQQVLVTATLTPSSGQSQITSGEIITFYNGSASLATAALSSGVATLNLTSLPVGTDRLTASFAGDTNFAPSSSAALPYSVVKTTPAVSLTAAPNPVALQSSAILTVNVSSALGIPTGSAVFSDGSTSLGTVSLNSGSATLTVTTLTAGSHSLTAAYGGDNNFVALTSSPAFEVVQNFELNTGGSTLSQTVQPGSIASYAIPIRPLGVTAFQTAISFSASGLPAGATATFSPQTIAAGSAASNVTLTIQVPNQTAMRNPTARAGSGLPVIALSLLMLPFSRLARRWGRYTCGMILMSSGVILAGLIGCSGGGSSSSTSPLPPQTYTVTITAASSSGAETLPVTLVVQ
jgi:Bacterial Ig-like domain (group 3)/FG-GAP-like repeat